MLSKFREQLLQRKIDIYVLPRTDEHQSQYLCECDERLAFLTGFTGSNGIAVVSLKEGLVWTDSRYFVQAVKQLQEGWELKKLGQSISWFQHIAQNYPQGSTISIDGRLIAAETGKLRKAFLEEKGFKVEFVEYNLVDQIWEQKPKPSCTDIYVHEQWSGTPAAEKIQWVRNKIIQHKGQGALFTDLSEIGWILNIRSGEIPYNPFVKSILVINPEGQSHQLFLPEVHHCVHTRSEELESHLKSLNVQVRSYPYLPLPANLLIQQKSLNYNVYSALATPIQWDGIGLYRAIRKAKELQGFRNSHIRDGVAMAGFWGWRAQKETVGEYEAAMQMDSRRYKQPLNKGLSFQTISAGGPNGAIVHYHPSNHPDFIMTKNMIHLLDSGGQYLDGTTDVTRTFHFGQSTAEERNAYTRVLLGNLDIERMVWPKSHSMVGQELDILARRRLWQAGLDYGHGTGHGVGHFQGVHEGPCGISRYAKTVFVPGMITSNEPGYYKQGAFGIRIQNLIVVVEDGDHYRFENLTLCPYDINLIEKSLLSKQDIDFINAYHKRCWDVLSPLLQEDEVGLNWLKHATRAI